MNTHLFAATMLLLTLTACGRSEPQAADAPAKSPEAGQVESQEAAGHGEEGHGDEHGGLKLTAEQIATAGIELAEAQPASIRETLPLYGVIAPNAERVREVAARYPGVIRSADKKVGDTVRQGEALATVESNESLQTYAVVAPLAGVVTTRNANPGEQTGDKLLFTVADLSTVWIELSLFPRDVAKVHVGQQVKVHSNDTGMSTDGKVVYVAPFGSSSNQTLTARVLLDNADRRWAPGLYVTAEVTLAETQVPLAVRNTALQTLEDRSVVFVSEGEGFEARPVQLGRNDSEYTELVGGLRAGERYAARNSFILKAELGKGEAAHED
jgi:cobalt-zinc-cadmium efflux system membrane fusion protein